MLDRNRRIKKCPERFQECKDKFDIIVTVEERVYDQVLEHMMERDVTDNRPVHIFNVDIEDNHEEALMGAFLITDMIIMVMINKTCCCKTQPLTLETFDGVACQDVNRLVIILRSGRRRANVDYIVPVNHYEEENLCRNIVLEKTLMNIFVLCIYVCGDESMNILL